LDLRGSKRRRKLHNLDSSTNIIMVIKSKRMRWVVYVERTGKMRNAYKILVGKRKGKRQLERFRCKWKVTIRIDIGEIG
jgi:hypothetical protein